MKKRNAVEIAKEVTRFLDTDGNEVVERLTEHLRRLARSKSDLSMLFRLGSRPSVRFYSSVSSVKKTHLKIDVRNQGVSCGEITLSPDGKRSFRATETYKELFPLRKADWADKVVRKYLDDVNSKLGYLSRESAVESAFISEVSKKSGKMKQPFLRWHQPVLLWEKIPYQFPLPIVARDGIKLPRGKAAGHSDVLVRAGRGERLRVFEIKREAAGDAHHALEQAVVYCSALRYLLEREPAVYFPALGYSRRRKSLKLEAVAFVYDSPTNRSVVERSAGRLHPLKSPFGLYAQFYKWHTASSGRKLVITDEIDFK